MIFIRTIVRSNVNGAFRGDIIQSIFLLFLLNNICGYIYIFVYDFIQIDRANVHYWIEHAAYIEYESCLSECHLAIGTITNVSRVWVALLLFPHLPKYLHLWQSSSFHNLLIWLQEKSETLVVQDWIMNKKKKKKQPADIIHIMIESPFVYRVERIFRHWTVLKQIIIIDLTYRRKICQTYK